MQDSPPVFILILVLTGLLGLVSTVVGIRLRPSAPSRLITLAAALPALVMLALFHSLALHMNQSLGGWPGSIGTAGFPPALVSHADIASAYFGVLLLVCLFVWPVASALSASIRHWRSALFHLGVFALSCSACFASTLLAPSEFLYWWWD